MNNYEKNHTIILPYGRIIVINDINENGTYSVMYLAPENEMKSGILKQQDINTLLSARYNDKQGVDVLFDNFVYFYKQVENGDFYQGKIYTIKNDDFILSKINDDDTVIIISTADPSMSWKLSKETFKTLILNDKSSRNVNEVSDDEEDTLQSDIIPEQIVATIPQFFIPPTETVGNDNSNPEISVKEDEEFSKQNFEDLVEDLITQLNKYPRDRYTDKDYENDVINLSGSSFDREIIIMKNIINQYEESLKVDYTSHGDKLIEQVTTFVKGLTLSDKETWSRELRMKLDNIIDMELNGEEPENDSDAQEVDFSVIEDMIKNNVNDFISLDLNKKNITDILLGKYNVGG